MVQNSCINPSHNDFGSCIVNSRGQPIGWITSHHLHNKDESMTIFDIFFNNKHDNC